MNLFYGLFKYKIVKKYDITKSANDIKLNRGRDYSKDLLTKSLSRHIQRNEIFRGFLGFVQDAFVENVKTVSKLKLFKAYTVNKDEWRTK